MSVYYDVKEHLQFTGKEDAVDGAYIAADVMKVQLAALAGLILLDEAKIYRLQMTADGKDYQYEGAEVTPEFKKILNAIDDSSDVDLEIEYLWRGSWTPYENMGPFALMKTIEERHDEFDWSTVFYSAWYRPDSGEGCGSLYAYGTKDGKTYNGEVSFEETTHVPSGEWIAQDTPIAASVKLNGAEADPAFIAACKAFEPFCEENDMSFDTYDDEDIYEFYLSNLTIRTNEEAQRVIELFKELRRLSTNQFGLMANLVDYSHKDARLMMIEEGEGEEFEIKVAMV